MTKVIVKEYKSCETERHNCQCLGHASQLLVTSSSAPDKHGYFFVLRLILWIALFVVAAEFAVEYRAYLRGWDTLLFGAVRSHHGAGTLHAAGAAPQFGPTAYFPFRGPIVEGPKPAGTIRIWFAAASHGEDIYLPPGATFPNLVGTKLRLKGVSVQVLNASRAGTGIDGDLAFLERDFDRWRPDFVVLYQMSLDVGTLSRHFLGSARSTGNGSNAEPGGVAPSAPPGGPSWATRLYHRTTSYDLLNAVVTTRISAMRPSKDDIGAPARTAFRHMLVHFVDEVRALGAQPVLCTFSTSFSPNSPAPIPRDVVLFVHRWTEHLSARGWLAAIEQLNGVVRDVAKEKGVLLVDTAAALTGREALFRDPVHFTAAGHDVLAETIASALLRTARLDQRVKQ